MSLAQQCSNHFIAIPKIKALDDSVIKYANKNGLIVPSNWQVNALLHDFKIAPMKPTSTRPEGIVTGTVAGLERKGKEFGKVITWKPTKNITKRFIVPEEHVGRVNCGLFANQGFDGGNAIVNVEIKSKKGSTTITYEIDPNYLTLIENIPTSRGANFPENKMWMPTSIKEGADALLLVLNSNREHPFIGPIARRNGQIKSGFPYQSHIDMNHCAVRPARTLLVHQDNMERFVNFVNKVHKKMMTPVVMWEETTGTVHATLGYGVLYHAGIQKGMFDAAKPLRNVDPALVENAVKAYQLERDVLGRTIIPPEHLLKLQGANAILQSGAVEKGVKLSAYFLKEGEDLQVIVSEFFGKGTGAGKSP